MHKIPYYTVMYDNLFFRLKILAKKCQPPEFLLFLHIIAHGLTHEMSFDDPRSNILEIRTTPQKYTVCEP